MCLKGFLSIFVSHIHNVADKKFSLGGKKMEVLIFLIPVILVILITLRREKKILRKEGHLYKEE